MILLAWLLISLFTLVMAIVIVYDVAEYVIPNFVNFGLLLFFPIYVWLAPGDVDWQGGLLAFAVLLSIGFVLFAISIIGGGDAKLLAALGLYVGWGLPTLHLVVYMALYGGLLSILLIVIRAILSKKQKKPRLFRHKEPVPYGLAIAVAFWWLLVTGRVQGLGEVQLF